MPEDNWMQEVWRQHCLEKHSQDFLFNDGGLQLSFDFGDCPP